MPVPADSQIAVHAGTAEPASVSLSPGQPIGPLSIGLRGAWRVVAPGVLDEHGFLYFNGSDLFLQSANPASPLLANGAAIPGEWTVISAPCEIAVGGARMWLGPARAPAAAPAPSRAPAASPSQRFAPRVQGNDDEEATRVAPIEELAALRASRGQVLPAAGRPAAPAFGAFGGPSPSPAAPSFGAPPYGPGAPPAPVAPSFGPAPIELVPPVPSTAGPQALPHPGLLPSSAPTTSGPMAPVTTGAPPGAGAPFPGPAAAPAKQSWIGARWREASGPKKALVVLMAPLIWALWVIFTDKPQAPARPAGSAAAPSVSAAPSASAVGARTGEPPVPPAASGAITPKPTASAVASSSPATNGAKTPQRDAADAVAEGAFDRAASLYEELAKAHPEVPAYAEAARIMRAKAGKR